MCAGRAGGGLFRTADAGHGAGGPERRLWRAAIPYGCQKSGSAGAYRVGDHLHQRYFLSSAGSVARGVSESVPAGDPHETAGKERRRRGYPGRAGGIFEGADLPDAPSRSSACWRFSAGTTCMPNCSATTTATKKRAIRPSPNARASLGIPVVATNGVAYATPAQRELLDVFTCVRNKVTLATAGRLLERNSERHVKTPAEMARLFADVPGAIARTLEISARLEFTLADLGYEFPRYPGAAGRDHGQLPAQARGRRRAPPLPAISRARPPADRTRAGAHRKARDWRATF